MKPLIRVLVVFAVLALGIGAALGIFFYGSVMWPKEPIPGQQYYAFTSLEPAVISELCNKSFIDQSGNASREGVIHAFVYPGTSVSDKEGYYFGAGMREYAFNSSYSLYPGGVTKQYILDLYDPHGNLKMRLRSGSPSFWPGDKYVIGCADMNGNPVDCPKWAGDYLCP